MELKFFYDQNSTNKESLIRIEVKDKLQNEIVRTIEFKKDSGVLRHLLNEVHIKDREGDLIERYMFEYHPGFVNQRWGRQDHWGFVNYTGNLQEISTFAGTDIRVELLNGYYDYDYQVGEGTTQSKDAQTILGGVLKSITYPTGRKSTFFFENHQYFHDYSEVKKAGGFRIAKLEEYDPVSEQTYIKEYKYGELEDGLGKVAHHPSVDDYYFEYYAGNARGIFEYPRISRVRKFVPYSLAKTNYDSGSSTVYDIVTEYQSTKFGDGYITKNGKMVQRYKLPNSEYNGHINGTPLNTNMYMTYWNSGQLLERKTYKFESNSYTLVENDIFEYGSFNYNNIPFHNAYPILQVRGNYDLVRDDHRVRDDYDAFKTVYSAISTGCTRLISEKNQSYTPDGIITSIRNYTYGNNKHLYPTKIATRNGNKDIKIETFVYPQDIVSPNVAEKNLVNTNQLNSLLKSNVSYGGRTWSEKTDYELKGGNARPVAIWSGISGEEEKRIKILNYDIYGNPLFITVDDADNVVYLWSYSGKYIIAEIKNATYTEVSNALVGTTPEQLSTSTVPDMSKVDALRATLPKAHVTTYNYKSLVGMVRKTDPNDVVTYYEHDSFDRLKHIKDYHQKIMNQYNYNYRP